MPRRRVLYAVAGLGVVLAVALGVAYLILRGRTGDVSNPGVPFSAGQRGAKVDPFEWPLYGHTPDHTRSYTPPKPLRGPWHVVWTYRARALLEFPPVLSHGATFQLADDAVVSSVDAETGLLRWRRRLGVLSASTPAVGDGVVYATVLARRRGLKAGSVTAMTSADGRVLWSRDLSSRAESSPLLKDGRLYFGTENGRVYCLDVKDGRVVWTYRATGAVKGSPTFGAGLLFFGDYGGQVHAVRAADGRAVWSSGTNGTLLGSGTFYATAAYAFGRIYIGNTDGREYSFSARDGRLAWAHQTGNYVYSSAAVKDVSGVGPTVFFGSYDGTFYALDARSGAVRWRRPLGAGSKISGSPTIVGDVVYFADLGRRRTHGLLARNGRPVFLAHHGSFDPMISDGRHLFLTGYSSLSGLLPGPAPGAPPAPPPLVPMPAPGHPPRLVPSILPPSRGAPAPAPGPAAPGGRRPVNKPNTL